jgi:hypothetical protein
MKKINSDNKMELELSNSFGNEENSRENEFKNFGDNEDPDDNMGFHDNWNQDDIAVNNLYNRVGKRVDDQSEIKRLQHLSDHYEECKVCQSRWSAIDTLIQKIGNLSTNSECCEKYLEFMERQIDKIQQCASATIKKPLVKII